MKTLTENILTKIALGAISLIGVAILSLWLIFQNSVVKYLTEHVPASMFIIGWLGVILGVCFFGLLAYVVYLRHKYADPFLNYDTDDGLRTVVNKKDRRPYCPTCLSNGKKTPVFLVGTEFLCVDKNCPNSRPSPRGTIQ